MGKFAQVFMVIRDVLIATTHALKVQIASGDVSVHLDTFQLKTMYAKVMH